MKSITRIAARILGIARPQVRAEETAKNVNFEDRALRESFGGKSDVRAWIEANCFRSNSGQMFTTWRKLIMLRPEQRKVIYSAGVLVAGFTGGPRWGTPENWQEWEAQAEAGGDEYRAAPPPESYNAKAYVHEPLPVVYLCVAEAVRAQSEEAYRALLEEYTIIEDPVIPAVFDEAHPDHAREVERLKAEKAGQRATQDRINEEYAARRDQLRARKELRALERGNNELAAKIKAMSNAEFEREFYDELGTQWGTM